MSMMLLKSKPTKTLPLLLSVPNPFKPSKSAYVDVKMKWKKDPFFDSIDHLTNIKDLRPLTALKNTLAAEPDHSVPISLVSKRDRELEISGRVASFLRRYPSFFCEYVGPEHNLPHFRLTDEALALHRLERRIYEERKPEVFDRLRRMILMSTENVLPFKIVQGLLWSLGLPEDFLKNLDPVLGHGFEVVDVGDGEKGLRAVAGERERVLSAVERNGTDANRFLLFPSKGLRLKRKIEEWLETFQELPYVSPYANCSGLDPNSDMSEKRAVGVLHEMLSLFVDASAERRRLLCLRKHLGLPQKFGKCFERHPHVFYLLLKEKTCFVVLKEAYCDGRGVGSGIERHPMLEVRRKYVKVMNKSEAILRSRRRNGRRASREGDADSENKEGPDGFGEVMEKAPR